MCLYTLADELLCEILHQIDPEKPITPERRAYLSLESFELPPEPDPDRSQDIANFRLTCKKFSGLGAIHQFSRVTTRFSRKGLKLLENIADRPHLATCVTKFSYMVPFFYVEGRARVCDLIPTLPTHLESLDVLHFIQKVKEQKEIVETQEDVRVLNKAISAFTRLQHVQILRLQDSQDALLISYIRQYDPLSHLVELRWAPACSHSTKTIGAALIANKSPCSRFSSPMLSPQSALGAVDDPSSTLSVLAERLTCLELHFDDSTDLDNRMRALSTLSRAVFSAAKNMKALHIGFPSNRPLRLKLEEVFHGIKWKDLSAFGIQAWRLDADEIIALARRHREQLRGLRLRDVLMKDDSRWQDVLAFLRTDMPKLGWVSLRRIDYERHFDQKDRETGFEILDDQFSASDSSEDEYSEDFDTHEDFNTHGDFNTHEDEDGGAPAYYEHDDQDSIDSFDMGLDDDEPEQGGDIDFASAYLDTPDSASCCNCDYTGDTEVLHDNGIEVSNQQRKFWEKWVVRKACAEHCHT